MTPKCNVTSTLKVVLRKFFPHYTNPDFFAFPWHFPGHFRIPWLYQISGFTRKSGSPVIKTPVPTESRIPPNLSTARMISPIVILWWLFAGTEDRRSKSENREKYCSSQWAEFTVPLDRIGHFGDESRAATANTERTPNIHRNTDYTLLLICFICQRLRLSLESI